MEPRQDKRNQIIGGIIIVAIILIGIAYYFSKQPASPGTPSNTATSTTTSATSTTVKTSASPAASISVTSASSNAGYTIHVVSAGNAPAAPDFKAALVFTSGISTDLQSSIQTQFTQAQAVLKSDSKNFNAWITLGDARKEAGDYAGAAADWQYALALYPSNVVSNANLADLYTNYLHKYPQAAAAYKAAIANNPTQVYLYQDLFSLYTNQYPQSTTTIIALLKQGLAANPNAAELKADLAKYQ